MHIVHKEIRIKFVLFLAVEYPSPPPAMPLFYTPPSLSKNICVAHKYF